MLSQQNRVLAGQSFDESRRITAQGKNVLVIGGGDTGSDIPGDAFSLNFAKIEVSYKEQDLKGGVGAETKAGWDLKQNKPV